MKSEFEIAKIIKPRGLKGEMKVQFYSSDVARFSHLKEVYVSGVKHEAVKIVADGEYGYVTLDDVNSVEQAEAMRGKMICALREDLPKLGDDKHYIADMIGLAVYAGGDYIGKLTDVLQYGSADVYVVKSADGSLSFPALKQLIKEVDLEGGKIILDEVTFARVVVYN
ncbi:MAG: ribosome maturation factor RimM [Bacteroides sp.]|nr:ribosome maturation factor RimM [Bacillota bacterium]MCM1393705.1 ribosome maturation factor RimM [[Eubacterium] siraeum]MCM1456079.1 ribosome maturation factor RimM [Bacteroides sp.]